MSTPSGKGRIRSFNPVTWWGEVEISPSVDPLKFHGTSFLTSSSQRLPEVGEEVLVIFADEARDKVVAIRAGARAEHRGADPGSVQAAG
jgi:hypothetical protein